MVKLVAARAHRLYGPRGTEEWLEILNSVVYFVGTVLLLGGMLLLLANFNRPLQYNKAYTGLILLAIAMAIIILINLHDMGAHVGGIDFRLDLLAYDAQLALVEVGVPLVYVIGGILYLIAIILLLKSKTLLTGGKQRAAVELLIAGSVFWVLGSLHNACQVYYRSSATVQLFQKAVYLPLLMGSTLLLVSSVLWYKSWPHFVVARSAQYGAIVIAIIAAVLIVLGALANIFRVLYLRRLVGGTALDTLFGRAYEELEGGGTSMLEPLLGTEAPAVGGPPPPPVAGATPEVPVEDVVEEETFAVIR